MVAVVAHPGEGVAVAVAKILRYVCEACGGVYFAPVNDRCPGCKGPMREREVTYDGAGVAHVKSD